MNGGLIKSCELVARVRSGRVVKSGMNGIVMYNAEWFEQHRDAELRKRGTWRELYYGETKYYMCSVCASAFPIKHIWCPICKTKMVLDLKTNGTEDEK